MSERPSHNLHQLIDDMLDGELAPEGRARLSAAAKRDPRVAEEVVRARRVASLLAAPIADLESDPDAMQQSILNAVAARGAVRSQTHRRRIGIGRALIAASVVLAVGGVFLVQRALPDLRHGGIAGPKPLASLVKSTQADATTGVRTLVASVAAPAPEMQSSPREATASVAVGVAVVRDQANRVRHIIRSGAVDSAWNFSADTRGPTLGAPRSTTRPYAAAAFAWNPAAAEHTGEVPVFTPLGVAPAPLASDRPGIARNPLVLHRAAVARSINAAELSTRPDSVAGAP